MIDFVIVYYIEVNAVMSEAKKEKEWAKNGKWIKQEAQSQRCQYFFFIFLFYFFENFVFLGEKLFSLLKKKTRFLQKYQHF